MIKRILKILGAILLTLLVVGLTYIYLTVPKLPDNSEAIIERVLEAELPELVQGQSGYALNQDVKIWYESIMPADTSKGCLLLFMGISNDALGWPPSFIDNLVGAGYQVVRFDYRGTGLSDWVENWQEHPYSLTDLAADAKAILDTLQIQKANLLGVSLGGMVAQEFAINYPEATHTLTSIMSSGNILDNDLPPIAMDIVYDLVKSSVKYGLIPSEKNTLKLHLSARVILRGEADYDIDIEETVTSVLYNLRKRKGYNPGASSQHHEATYRSGSRYEALAQLDIPVLVIHGEADPFIPVEHSKKLATIVPNAKEKYFENMGHDVPANLTDEVCAEIIRILDTDHTAPS